MCLDICKVSNNQTFKLNHFFSCKVARFLTSYNRLLFKDGSATKELQLVAEFPNQLQTPTLLLLFNINIINDYTKSKKNINCLFIIKNLIITLDTTNSAHSNIHVCHLGLLKRKNQFTSKKNKSLFVQPTIHA